MNWLSEWLSSNGFMLHGFCYQWNPTLVWLHAISDILIALAYFLIPVALIYFVRKRQDFPFGWMFICFGVFIAARGATHVMDVWTLWFPSYWFSAGVKVITALVSVPMAIFLVRLMPTTLSLPSPEQMRAANEQLKRQAARLQESEERFRQMADNIQEIFWMMNPETKEASYASPAFEQICELPLDSLYSNPTSYRELIHSDDRQRVLAGLENLQSTNRFDEEFRIVCPSGTVKWLRAIGFVVKDSVGRVLTFVGTAQEITTRKEMEAILRESEDRYRDLVEHSTDLICTYNLQGRLLTVNELPVKLLGYSQEELLSKPMRDLLLPEARAQFDESLLNIQTDGFVKGLVVVLTKTGERRIWEYHNTLRTEGVTVPIVRGIAHDVTDQKRLGRALRLSEEKFAKAFRSSPVEMAIASFQEGQFLDVNEAFQRNTGFTRDEVIGHTSIELGMWDNPDDRVAIIEQIKQRGRLQGQEIRFRTKSGTTRVKRYSAEQIEMGGRQCLLTVCDDITDRKRVEQALEAVKNQFDAILSHSPNLIFLKDVEGHYLLINKEYRKTFHFMREEIYGKKDIEIFPAEQAAVFRGSDLQVLEARAPKEFEEVALHDDGPHTSIVQKFPLFDTDGKIYAICGFVTDITERKRADATIREERDRAQLYLDIADVILLALDLEGRITLINRKGCSTLKWEEQELLGHDWIETCIPVRIRENLRASFKRLVSGDLSSIENPVLTKSGKERLIAWHNTLLRDGEGRVTGTLSSGEDITERKRTEDELRQLSGRLLQSQDEERRRIARDLHDSTGQDLVALTMMLGELRGSIPSDKRKLRRLVSDCKALVDLCIRDVRTLSYLLHPPSLDAVGLGGAIRDYVGGFSKRSGIQVDLELSPHVGRMARDVELALFRVVQEALTNIQRHSGSQQAKIRIHCNSDLTLEISDEGQGTSASSQGMNQVSRLGTGVGIPNMRERVKHIGGRFEIESTNHGTTVSVTMPLARDEYEKTSHPIG